MESLVGAVQGQQLAGLFPVVRKLLDVRSRFPSPEAARRGQFKPHKALEVQ